MSRPNNLTSEEGSHLGDEEAPLSLTVSVPQFERRVLYSKRDDEYCNRFHGQRKVQYEYLDIIFHVSIVNHGMPEKQKRELHDMRVPMQRLLPREKRQFHFAPRAPLQLRPTNYVLITPDNRDG